MKKALIIIAPYDFRDEELFDTIDILKENGIDFDISSTVKGDIKGKLGGIANSSILIKEANIDDYAALVIIGGPGALSLGTNEEFNQIVKAIHKKNKIIAAICIAPVLLAQNNVIKNKRCTVWNGDQNQSKIIKQHGGIYLDKDNVIDGNLITANGPKAAKKFGEQISDKLLG